jgi:hypothetical protein
MSIIRWLAPVAHCGNHLLLTLALLGGLLISEQQPASQGQLEPFFYSGVALPAESPSLDNPDDVELVVSRLTPFAASLPTSSKAFPVAAAALRLHITRSSRVPQGPPGII